MKLVKKSFRKTDGRLFIQYHRTCDPRAKSLESHPQMIDEGLVRPPQFTEPTVRYNTMRQEWVAISSSRNDRPFLPPANYCPLCPVDQYSRNEQGIECKTDVPLMTTPYEWAVLENMFPGLGHGNQTGHCEVILYSKEHNRPLSQSSPEEIEGLIQVWQDRSQEVGARHDVKLVYIFENKGVEVGVTLHHPHGQIYGMNHIPPFVERELAAALTHHQHTGSCLICATAHEEAHGPRLVARTNHLIAYVPEAARYPYEVHVTTLKHRHRVEDLTPAETAELSHLMKILLTKYNLLMDREFPYIMGQHQVPHKSFDKNPLDAYEKAYHWHMEFYPPYRAPGKLKYLAGVESGTGLFINDTIPENKAHELREIKTPYDSLITLDAVAHTEKLTQKTSVSASRSPQTSRKTLVRAPGRINLIGEHTDYNGGKVLPFAFDRHIEVCCETLWSDHELSALEAAEESPIIRVSSQSHQPDLVLSLKSLHNRVKSLVDCGHMAPGLTPADLRPHLLPHERDSWQRYLVGVLMEWWFTKQHRCGFSWSPASKKPGEPRLIHLHISSTLPAGAGVSSSAALCMGVLLGLDHEYRTLWNGNAAAPSPLTRDAAAIHAMRVEHQFAGTRCGLMDQLAVGKSRGGSFLMIDFGNLSSRHDLEPTEHEIPSLIVYPHPVFTNYQWLLINSKVHHNLGASPYNERRQSCEQGLQAIQRFWSNQNFEGAAPTSLGVLACIDPFLREFAPDGSQATLARELYRRGILADPMTARRVAHAIMENHRVDAAVRALKGGSPRELHDALRGSHRSLADDYEVSCPEIEHLGSLITEKAVDLARSLQPHNDQPTRTARKTASPEILDLPPLLGPRMTGGGFGGSMVVGVHHGIKHALIDQLISPHSSYAQKTGLVPEVFEVSPQPGLEIFPGVCS